ncbi:MAG: M56 family metallopeptidase [Bacteroidetes bacterium]|nr:M56 family metallopeptidase [Bacteroidota bacterium]
MAHFSYSFCMSMLHSLWQAGILYLAYLVPAVLFQHRLSPLQKRNWLYILVLSQLLLFTVTFFIYYSGIDTGADSSILLHRITEAVPADTLATFAPWIFGAYIVIIVYRFTRAWYQWKVFKTSFYTGLEKPVIDLKLFTMLKAEQFGIKRKIQLWFSTTIDVPLTFGFLKPVIVLPVALVNQISLQQAETLILHELSHIKANDYLLNRALLAAEHIFFFNPFVMGLCKKIRLEREKYCDSTVIAFNYTPLLYAEALLKTQQVQKHISLRQLAAVTGKKQLLQRILFFTQAAPVHYTRRNRFILPVLSCIFALVLFAAIALQAHISGKNKPAAAAMVQPVSGNPIMTVLPATENPIAAIPELVRHFTTTFTDDNLKKIVSAVEKQEPVIEKQLQQLQPLIKTIQDKAEDLSKQMETGWAVPVVQKDNTLPVRQIIVKEEQSGSKNAVLKVYNVTLINGQWVVVPQWVLSAKEIAADSLHLLIDSTAPDEPQE